MSDETTDDNVQASEQEATVENTADSQTEEQSNTSTETEVSQETTESTESGNTESKADSESRENKSQENKNTSTNQDEKVDSKPLSRRSAQFRIQQLVEENKALKQKQKPAEQIDEWEAPAEDETQPNIAELVAKEVEKRLHPVISESTKTADDAEINELFGGDRAAERTSYEPKIREMWQLPQYKDVAATDLYKIAKFDELSNSMDSVRQQAVEDYKKAQKEAKDSSASGTSNTSNRLDKTAKSITQMTDAELLEHNERVKAGLV